MLVFLLLIITIVNATNSSIYNTTINLGSCSLFAVLAGTTVSFNGALTTVSIGSVGVSPGLSISGNYAIEDGAIEDNSATAVQCAADNLIAYNQAALITCANILASSDLSGLTLQPGVYCTQSGHIIISASTVTLDALNDTNAVWLFQSSTSITTATTTSFILKNGAKASNVFWKVGSSANIGYSSEFVGTILAYVSISFGTNSVINGRALAQAAVSFAGGSLVNSFVGITKSPTLQPTVSPSLIPTFIPTISSGDIPSSNPSNTPSRTPTVVPSNTPTINPVTFGPSLSPSNIPTEGPTTRPSLFPTNSLSSSPSTGLTPIPSIATTNVPTITPSKFPTGAPVTIGPSTSPSVTPTNPTTSPSNSPTRSPLTITPSLNPSCSPTIIPTKSPSKFPTNSPVISLIPSNSPSIEPTASSSFIPTTIPNKTPTISPTVAVTIAPTLADSHKPTFPPTLDSYVQYYYPISQVITSPVNASVFLSNVDAVNSLKTVIASVLSDLNPSSVDINSVTDTTTGSRRLFNFKFLSSSHGLLYNYTVGFYSNDKTSSYASSLKANVTKLLDDSVNSQEFTTKLQASSSAIVSSMSSTVAPTVSDPKVTYHNTETSSSSNNNRLSKTGIILIAVLVGVSVIIGILLSLCLCNRKTIKIYIDKNKQINVPDKENQLAAS